VGGAVVGASCFVGGAGGTGAFAYYVAGLG
jgi:hypothetical protein